MRAILRDPAPPRTARFSSAWLATLRFIADENHPARVDEQFS